MTTTDTTDTTDNDTSTLDEKKNEDNSSDNISIEDYLKKFGNYLLYILVFIIFIAYIFLNGSFLLFLAKLAQSNILPTEKKCSPYTDSKISVEKLDMDIFTTIDKSIPEQQKNLSMKISFNNNEYNSKNYLIDSGKYYKYSSSSTILNYLIDTFESILQKDYLFLNIIMNWVNNNFSEWAIILFSPIILTINFLLMIFVDFLSFCYFWFVKMSWFFKTNTNEKGKPNWENDINPVNWILGCCLVFIFFILFLILLFVGTPIILFRVLYVIITSLLYKGVINQNINVNAFSLIFEIIKNYKLSIIWTITIFIVILSLSYLGLIPGLLTVLVVYLIYSKKIDTDIFDPISLKNYTSYIGNFNQATKKCYDTTETNHKNGFLYNLLLGYLLNLLGLSKMKKGGENKQSGGKKLDTHTDLIKILKKLNKT